PWRSRHCKISARSILARRRVRRQSRWPRNLAADTAHGHFLLLTYSSCAASATLHAPEKQPAQLAGEGGRGRCPTDRAEGSPGIESNYPCIFPKTLEALA